MGGGIAKFNIYKLPVFDLNYYGYLELCLGIYQTLFGPRRVLAHHSDIETDCFCWVKFGVQKPRFRFGEKSMVWTMRPEYGFKSENTHLRLNHT